MAKFIIEISDEQIRDMANSDKIKEQTENDKDMNPMRVLFNMMAGVIIGKKLEAGITEFNISRDMMDDKQKQDYFDRNVGDICMLAHMAMKDEEKKDAE